MSGGRHYVSPKPTLTGILNDVAEVAGEGAAIELARAKGGQERVYIPLPVNLHDDHWLVQLLGQGKAKAIAEILGGGHIEIPINFTGKHGQTWFQIVERLREGKSGAEIALELGVHQRTVRRVRSRFEILPKNKDMPPKA